MNVAEISTPDTLVIFDGQVQDLDVLHQALRPDAMEFTLNAQDDALLAITQLLTGTGATNLAIVAHGEPGSIRLGREAIDRSALERRSNLLQEWCVDEILFYFCDVGIDSEFMSAFQRLTGAKISATPCTL